MIYSHPQLLLLGVFSAICLLQEDFSTVFGSWTSLTAPTPTSKVVPQEDTARVTPLSQRQLVIAVLKDWYANYVSLEP